jgi:uncharacterized protein YjeT (DUF2065 family)
VKDFLTALALVLVIEGVSYALFPAAIQRMMARALSVPPPLLRVAGLAATAAGVAGVWVVRSAMIAP